MSVDFTSIDNHNEHLVFEKVLAGASSFPTMLGNQEWLADVACVALNRLPPRYIRHRVDLAFYLSEAERANNERAVADAVDHAFEFVQSRNRAQARS